MLSPFANRRTISRRELDNTPGAWSHLCPQVRPWQSREHTRTGRAGATGRLPELRGVQLAPTGETGGPGKARMLVEKAQGLRDRAAVGVSVHEQGLAGERQRFEREVDRDGGAAGR